MAMRFCVLASGSSGNCTLVTSGATHLLIDAGNLPKSYVTTQLAELGLRVDDLHAILLTHSHGDHLGTVALSLASRAGIPLWLHPSLLEAHPETVLGQRRHKRLHKLHAARKVKLFESGAFGLRDLAIEALPMPHAEPTVIGAVHAFTLRANGAAERTFFYGTDIGHVTAALTAGLGAADAAVLESNHDVDMEHAAPRPDKLKAWVLSDRGHLSNAQAAAAAAGAFAAGPARRRTLVLAHLSRECNTVELAEREMRTALVGAGVGDVTVQSAAPAARTALLDV
ncbi:MAG: MBL fold metallo-hydrolase [Planctomycetes bacterium]|nr:MBL fold metallo-hydrolase [Planctomycetota bacterium]